jgi:hypothetical protein
MRALAAAHRGFAVRVLRTITEHDACDPALRCLRSGAATPAIRRCDACDPALRCLRSGAATPAIRRCDADG